MMNAKKGRFKLSKVEYRMNRLVFFILIFQILLALIVAFFGLGNQDDSLSYKYLNLTEDDFSKSKAMTLTFFRYFLLLNTLIPISLIVSIEMVKVI